MRLKKIAIITVLICVFNQIYAQNGIYKDTVYLKNDIKIPCNILETGSIDITILFGDSDITTINTENIDNYIFADFKTFKKNRHAEFQKYSNNTVFFEGFGNGLYFSINYDRIFYRTNKLAASFRIGFTQYETGGLLPIELNLLGKGRKTGCFTEIGAGYTPLIWSDYNFSTMFFRIGFRYQQPKGGLFFRVAFLPSYQFPFTHSIKSSGMGGTFLKERFGGVRTGDGSFVVWYGFSIGYTIPK
jgi:hypothetical protein